MTDVRLQRGRPQAPLAARRAGRQRGRCAAGAFALVAGAVLTGAGLVMAFFFTGPVTGAAVEGFELVGGQVVQNKLLLSQKIFFFHMPAALVSLAAVAVGAGFCAAYLARRKPRFDTSARVAMEISLVFVIATMITGDVWTRFEWGVWWTWDPRLTTYLILMLAVIAYFVLRNSVDDPERRALYASVVGIVAFVDVPICFAVTRLLPSGVHPVVLRAGGMAPDVAVAAAVCAIGMFCVAYGLYSFRLRQALLAERLEALAERIDENEQRARFASAGMDAWVRCNAGVGAPAHAGGADGEPAGERSVS